MLWLRITLYSNWILYGNYPQICCFVRLVNMNPPSHSDWAVLSDLIDQYFLKNCSPWSSDIYRFMYETNTYVVVVFFFFGSCFLQSWTVVFSLVKLQFYSLSRYQWNLWKTKAMSCLQLCCKRIFFLYGNCDRGDMLFFCHVFRACCCWKCSSRRTCTRTFVNVVLQQNKFMGKQKFSLFSHQLC